MPFSHLEGINVLYNSDDLQDVISVLSFVNGYTLALGAKKVAIDTEMIEGVVKSCKADFPHVGGIQTASAFKQAANFVCFFVASQPLPDPFPVEIIGKDLAKIPNHQNAMVAFAIAEAALSKSTIRRSDGDIMVEHPIEYSWHSYIDIIDALAVISPVAHFKLVTVLFEQLVYKSNPKCQYEVVKKW